MRVKAFSFVRSPLFSPAGQSAAAAAEGGGGTQLISLSRERTQGCSKRPGARRKARVSRWSPSALTMMMDRLSLPLPPSLLTPQQNTHRTSL